MEVSIVCKLYEIFFCFDLYWYYSINSKYLIINGYIGQVLKYSSTQILKYSSPKSKLKY